MSDHDEAERQLRLAVNDNDAAQVTAACAAGASPDSRQFAQGRAGLHESVMLNHVRARSHPPLRAAALTGRLLRCCQHTTTTQLDAMRALLRAGADVNVLDDRGWSPLHYAADVGMLEAARCLLVAGTSPRRSQRQHAASIS